MNVPPGFMKSLMTDVFWPAWEWSALDRPSNRYVAFSYAAHLTERDNGRFRDLVRSALFRELWGHRFALTEDGKVRVGNDKTGWKFASSVGGVGTGERGDRVILDDPHNVKESESQAVRDETVRWFKEAMQNRLNDMKEGAIVVIMQRVHEGDVSGCIISEFPEYVHLCIPMAYEADRHCITPIWQDWRMEEGELAWPERFDETDLRPFKAQKYAWEGQYQQRPTPRGGGIIKWDAWEVWDKIEANKLGLNENQFPAFDYVVASCDTAYTEKTENDYSACVVLGTYRDAYERPRIMVCAAWHERLELEPLVRRIIRTCRLLRVHKLIIEAKASGHSVAQEVRRLTAEEPISVEVVDPKNMDKVSRAYSVQPLFAENLENGRRRSGVIYIPYVTDADGRVQPREWADTLMTEAKAFPKGMHDDMVDALCQGLKHLRDRGLAVRDDEALVEIDRELRAPVGPPKALYPT